MSLLRRGSITTGLLVMTLAPAARLVAQATAPTVELGKRDARSKYAFGHLVAVAELPDGRVVASDAREAAFRLLDLGHGTDSLIGRQGDAAEEYASAGTVLTGLGDSLYLFDGRGQKFLRLAPDGHLAAPLRYAPPSDASHHVGLPMVMDASGRVYAVCFDIDTAARPMHLSQAVCRGTGAGAEEKVLSLDSHAPTAAAGNGVQIFPFRDAWAARRDGTMALVVADSYDVVWSRDGHEIGRTGPLPYQPIPLTAAEQRAATDSVHEMMQALRTPIAMPPGNGGRTTVSDGGGGMAGGVMFISRDGGGAASATASGGAPQHMTMAAPADMPIAPFPPFKPPIPSGGTVAIFAPDGLLWVARERAHGDRIPTYDVIAEGKGVVAHVRLPPDTRLVGLGQHGVYLAHRDGDEEWLERYVMPTVTP